ncbi:hypothetical protein [Paenibacillus ferrarius]|uniref:hypothetical protein n=1 Tax=Paenibacillus ferrarius TaxID=1469647 RepID=UPI003D2862AA
MKIGRRMKQSAAAMACVMALTGCSAVHSSAGTVLQHHAASDHHDAGAGAVPQPNPNPQQTGQASAHHIAAAHSVQGGVALEGENHRNTQITMNRELADQLIQEVHLGSTYVAMTDNSIYVAVDMGGTKSDKVKARALNKQDAATGAGLFGSGEGAQMDWRTAKPLAPETLNGIKRILTRIYPDSRVYISSNANFVDRLMFYDMQQRSIKHVDAYLNEFNTMVQYVFPNGAS